MMEDLSKVNSEISSEHSFDLPPTPPRVPSRKDWKKNLRRLVYKIGGNFNKEGIKKAIQNFDPQTTAEWVSRTLQKRGTAFYGTLTTVVLSTYFVADLTALVVEEYIPQPPPPRLSRSGSFGNSKSLNEYTPIFSRNLLNSQGLIPGDEGPSGAPSDLGGPPVRTTLPINLIGTLIMLNELRSIATIEDKSASIVYPVRIGDEIPGKMHILKIEPRRVIFMNKISNRREFIDLPEELQRNTPVLTGRSGPGIEKVAPTQFNVSRSEVDRALADFNNILTQARAVPNFENGVAAGYKLFQIVPGSIYDKLGLQNGDIINGLNGQPINDPGKAFEMLSELKTSNHLELQVKKDGRQSTYTYDIH